MSDLTLLCTGEGMMLNQFDSYIEKSNNLNPYLTPYTKISARQIVFAIPLYLVLVTNCEDNMEIYALL